MQKSIRQQRGHWRNQRRAARETVFSTDPEPTTQADQGVVMKGPNRRGPQHLQRQRDTSDQQNREDPVGHRPRRQPVIGREDDAMNERRKKTADDNDERDRRCLLLDHLRIDF